MRTPSIVALLLAVTLLAGCPDGGASDPADPTETTSPADAADARAVLDRFLQLQVDGHYDAAMQLVAAASFEAFARETGLGPADARRGMAKVLQAAPTKLLAFGVGETRDRGKGEWGFRVTQRVQVEGEGETEVAEWFVVLQEDGAWVVDTSQTVMAADDG